MCFRMYIYLGVSLSVCLLYTDLCVSACASFLSVCYLCVHLVCCVYVHVICVLMSVC